MARYINPMFVGPDKTRTLTKAKDRKPLPKTEEIGTYMRNRGDAFVPKTETTKKDRQRQ
jgi:hypothetical protein